MGELQAIFTVAAVLAGVDPALLSSVCFIESAHKPKAYVANDGGSPSIGLCQVKLSTARFVGFKGTARELFDPRVNALHAAKYLRWQYDRYGSWKKAVSAFNCGRACNNRRYVKKVWDRYEQTRGMVAWEQLR